MAQQLMNRLVLKRQQKVVRVPFYPKDFACISHITPHPPPRPPPPTICHATTTYALLNHGPSSSSNGFFLLEIVLLCVMNKIYFEVFLMAAFRKFCFCVFSSSSSTIIFLCWPSCFASSKSFVKAWRY